MADHTDIDTHSGTATTGHAWDGIKELNTPLPRWWIWIFYATIVWSVGYWIVYPAWPLIASHTTGLFGYSSRADVATQMATLQKLRGEQGARLQTASLEEIEKTPALLAHARAQGKAAFGDNCAPCHGTGASGAKGYPNLNDDDWLWGGKLADIHKSIEVGIRSGHADARDSTMPAFGRDNVLKREEIVDVTAYTRSLSGLKSTRGNTAKGKELYSANCAVCHGDDGKGNQELGAPNLTDGIWLHGSDEAAVAEFIANPKNGVMPAWAGRLDPVTIKSLAVYIHSLGGGK
jgi:cytochrome c oxidase cbb3-type subunit 3